MNPAEFEKYVTAQVQGHLRLEEARDAEKKKVDDGTLSDSERANAAARFKDLGVQLLLWDEADRVFRARFSNPEPPTEDDVKQATDTAKRLAETVAQLIKGTAMFDAVVSIIGAFSEFASKPGPGAGVQGAPAMPNPAALAVQQSTTQLLRVLRERAPKT